MQDRATRIAEFFAGTRAGAGTPDQVPAELVPHSLAEAYAAQAALVDRLGAALGGEGRRPVGFKVACTSGAAQKLLRMEHPVFGRLLAGLCHPDGAPIAAGGLRRLGVEPEFAFRMAADVPTRAGPWDRESIAPFIGEMLPALEIVGHDFREWDALAGPTLAADNATNRHWVSGAATGAWRGLDLAAHAVRLQVNGQDRLDGSGANVLGHPLNAIAWLAGALPEHGLALRAGDLVTTGVCTDSIHPTGPGESVRADFGALGTVTARITA